MKQRQSEDRPCALVRVSTDDQDTRQQEFEVLAYCRQRWGIDLPETAIYREEGVSGRNEIEDRPGLQAAVRACLTGTFTHLVVHKMDRSARNLAVMAKIIRDLDKADVAFIAIMEQIDTSQFGAKLVAHLMLSFAEHFSDNLGKEVRKGKAKRKRLGLHNGHLPFGVAQSEDGTILPDTRPITILSGESTNHAGLTRIFELAAGDYNFTDIAAEMTRLGYLPPSSVIWSRSTIRRILYNRFYLGMIPLTNNRSSIDRNPEHWTAGKHQPLIAADLWRRAHVAVGRHTAHPQTTRSDAIPHALGGGIVRCAPCLGQGKDIGMHYHNDKTHPMLLCGNRRKARMCQSSSIRVAEVERNVLAFLDGIALPQDQVRQALDAYQRQQGTTRHHERHIKDVTTRLEREADLYALGHRDRATYLATRRELEDQLRRLTAEASPTPQREHVLKIGEYLAYLPRAWQDASEEQRRRLVRLLIEAVWVENDQVIAITPSPQLTPYLHVCDPIIGMRLRSHTDDHFPTGTLIFHGHALRDCG